jgi:hypothetical protein
MAMTEQDKPLEGKVVSESKLAVPVTDGFSAILQLADAAQNAFLVHQTEASKRARLSAYQETEVGRIKAAESTLRNIFEQVFAERRSVYQDMFARLDRALDEGNNDALRAVVLGIVDIAKNSPLADVGDLSQVRAALDDPDQVWEL